MRKHNSYRSNHTPTLIAAISQAYWCVLWGIRNVERQWWILCWQIRLTFVIYCYKRTQAEPVKILRLYILQNIPLLFYTLKFLRFFNADLILQSSQQMSQHYSWHYCFVYCSPRVRMPARRLAIVINVSPIMKCCSLFVWTLTSEKKIANSYFFSHHFQFIIYIYFPYLRIGANSISERRNLCCKLIFEKRIFL